MSGKRAVVEDRRIVIRCHAHKSRAEIRQSILKHLLREYYTSKHLMKKDNKGSNTGKGSGSDAGDW